MRFSQGQETEDHKHKLPVFKSTNEKSRIKVFKGGHKKKMKTHLYTDLTLHNILAPFSNEGLNHPKKKKKKCILYFIERPRPILYFTERPRCPSLCSDTHVEKTLYLGFHFLYLVSPANCLYFLLSSFFRSCFSVILRWKVAY